MFCIIYNIDNVYVQTVPLQQTMSFIFDPSLAKVNNVLCTNITDHE